MISIHKLKLPISLFPGVWREYRPNGGRWLLVTHNGPREVDYGSIVLKIGKKTWVMYR